MDTERKFISVVSNLNNVGGEGGVCHKARLRVVLFKRDFWVNVKLHSEY